jgi:hypothetical protein
MILYYKTKILISGIFPMVDFKLDGFVEKTGLYNENMIDANDSDYIFYSSGHLLNSMYSCKEKEGNHYEYFENEEMIKYEVDDEISRTDIEKKILDEQFEKVNLLQKKIRLLTGIGITLPVFKTNIYNDRGDFYTYVGGINWEVSRIAVSDYDTELKTKLEQRLHLYIADSTVINLEEKNIRYKRALNFYLRSFESQDVGIRFTLLFSALESLFNISGDEVTKEVSTYSSNILFLSSEERSKSKWKISTYYDIRSRYIHGNDGYQLTAKQESELRDYVREILLIYWNISMVYNIYDPQNIKELINNTKRNNLDIQVQLFIKYMRTPFDKYSELYNQIRSEFLNKNYSVLSNKNIM